MNAVTRALLGLFVWSGLAAVALVRFMEAVRGGQGWWVTTLCIAIYLVLIRLMWGSAQAWRRAKGWHVKGRSK